MEKNTIMINNEQLNSLVVEMVNNNEIEGLLDFYVNGNKMEYKLDGLVSLKEKYSSKMTFEELKTIFNNIKVSLESFKEFMIFEKDILLSVDYIFQDVDGKFYFLVNLDKSKMMDIKYLFNEIMNTCFFEEVDHAKKLLEINNYLNTLNYSFEGLYNKFFNNNKKTEKKNEIIEEKVSQVKEKDFLDLKKKDEKRENISKKFFSFFKKKPYKTKSLDIDFKLPKDN